MPLVDKGQIMRSLTFRAAKCRRSLSIFYCLVGLWFGWSEIPAAAASFDCRKATTAQEKAICASAKLSKMDEDLAAVYNQLRAALSPAGAAEVQDDQRQWLAWLKQVCRNWGHRAPDIGDCLTDEYGARLNMLTHGTQRLGGMTFFTRLKVVTRRNTYPHPDYGFNSGDPTPFGVGSFRWPEIDRPTAQQAAWNSAVRQAAIKQVASVASGASLDADGNEPQTDFPSNVSDENVSLDYAFHAANQFLITVDLSSSLHSYDGGSEDPHLFGTTFTWLVRLGKELSAEDVFASDSGWGNFVALRCYEKMTTGEYAEYLDDDKQRLRREVANSVGEVDNWKLDAQKLELTFNDVSQCVPPGCHHISIPVELHWKELTPYLAKGFNPSILPVPVAAAEAK
jgi:uncharacterized protein YecT (DUF1311 family)